MAYKSLDNSYSISDAISSAPSSKSLVTEKAIEDVLFGFPRAYTSGRWYVSPRTAGMANFTVSANRLYSAPFVVTKTTTFDKIGLHCVTAAAGNVRLGIYTANSSDQPSVLITDAGAVALVDATQAEVTFTLPMTLNPGHYYLGAVFDQASTVLSSASTANFSINSRGCSILSESGSYLYKSHTYGALPSPFGATSDGNGSGTLVLRAQ